MTKRSSGFKNDAANEIWNGHIGNNAFAAHRDQCPRCQDAIKRWQKQSALDEFLAWRAELRIEWCAEGEHIFKVMFGGLLIGHQGVKAGFSAHA